MICGVNPVIGLIAVIDSVRDWYCAVSGDIQPQHQLLQIGAMILVLSIGELFTCVPTTVLADKSDSGRVMVDLSAIEIEDLDGSECQSEKDILVSTVIELL